MRRDLPSVRFQPYLGLNTKFNPDALDGAYLVRSQNADGFGRFLGWGKVPGSSRVSDFSGTAWHSLNYFEYFDLDSVLTRERLGVTGDRLCRIESDRSLTTIKSGMAAEPLSQVVQLDRLHLCSPGNEPFKYDGVDTFKWGVDPPGSDEDVIDAIDDAAALTINGTNTKSNTTASIDGAAVVCNKVDTTTNFVSLSRTATFNFASGQDGFTWWVFIPRGALASLRELDYSLDVTLSDGTNTSSYRKDRGELSEGWNALFWVLSAPDATTGPGSLSLGSVTTWTVSIFTAANSTIQNGFRLDYVYVNDGGAPEPSLNGAGIIEGTVSYRMTFLTKFGVESNAGPISDAVTASLNQIELSLPTATDPQVIARRIYRDLDGDNLFRLVTEIQDNVTTTFTDNVDSAGLAATTPPLAGDSLDDNRPPPKMLQVVEYQGHIFGISAINRFQLEISDVNEPESFPILNRREFQVELTQIRKHARGLILYHNEGYFVITGNDLASLRFDEAQPRVGASGWRAGDTVKSLNQTWHDDGPYVHDSYDPWYLGSVIKDQIEALDPKAFQDIHMLEDRSRFRVVSFIQSAQGGDYDTVLSYGYGKQQAGQVSAEGSGVDALDQRVGSWTNLVLPSGCNPLCSAIMEREADRPELWIGCDDGWVYWIQDPDAIDWAVGGGTEAVSCTMETMPARMGRTHEDAGSPRYLAIGASATVESTWTCTIKTLSSSNGKELDSVTFDFAIGPGETSPIVPIPRIDGAGLVPGPYVSVVLSNDNAGENGIFQFIDVHYVPRRFRGPRAS